MREKERITGLKKEAARFRAKQKNRQAAGAYRQLTELDPANPTWPHKLGQVLKHMGQAAGAMDALERAAENYLNKGFVLKAIAMCKMILELDPDHTRIQETLLLLHERNPRPRRTARQKQLKRDKLQAAPVKLPAPRPPAAPPMAPINEVELDPEQLQAKAGLVDTLVDNIPVDTAPVITPVDTGQILSAVDEPPLEILPPAAPPTRTPLEDIPEVAPLEEVRLAMSAKAEAEAEAETDTETEARRRRSADSLENIPLAVALPDVRPAAHAPTTAPVYEVPLEAVWVEIDMDDEEDEEDAEDRTGEELLARMPPIPLLSSLSTDELRSFITKVRVDQYQQEDAIIRQGAWGDTLYVLVQGTVGVFHQGPERVVTLGMHSEGTFFGEYALLTNLRHSATVEAMDDCTVLSISRKVVRELVDEHPPVLKVLLSFFRERLIQNLTANHLLFRTFSASERAGLVGQFHFLEAPANRVLVREGQRPDGLYLLVCGQATVHRAGAESSDLHMGEMFCKTALLSRTVSSNTVRTASKCWLLWMPRETFGEVIMTHPQVLATLAVAKTTGKLTLDELGFDDHEETLTVV